MKPRQPYFTEELILYSIFIHITLHLNGKLYKSFFSNWVLVAVFCNVRVFEENQKKILDIYKLFL